MPFKIPSVCHPWYNCDVDPFLPPCLLTLSWNSVMSHNSASRWLPRFSAAMYLRMFSCLIPGVVNTSLSFSHDSLFFAEEDKEEEIFEVFLHLVTKHSEQTSGSVPGLGRSWRPHIHSSSGPSRRSQSAPWPSPPAAAGAWGPAEGRQEEELDPGRDREESYSLVMPPLSVWLMVKQLFVRSW